MKIDVFAHQDSQLYLLAVLGDKSQRRGMKSQAASFIGCHTTAISQILHGKVRLTLEQADRFNAFLGHNEEESHYFLLLVQKERAGSRSLARYFKNQIERLLEDRLSMKKRLGQTATVSKENEQRYYSAWHYAAIHVALSIPSLRDAESLARHFRLPSSVVHETLSFLLAAGLAVQNKDELSIGPKHLHLISTSPHVLNHHRAWRLKALQDLESGSKSALHYSAAITLSRNDVIVVRETLIEHLKSLNKVVQASPEEEVYAMGFDFFRL